MRGKGIRANRAVNACLNRRRVCAGPNLRGGATARWPHGPRGAFASGVFLRKMPAFRHTSRISRHGHSYGQPEQTAKAPSPSGRCRAVADFNMIEDGDKNHGLPVRWQGQLHHARCADALAEGGADQVRDRGGEHGSKQPGFPEHVLPAYLKELGIEYHIVEKDTYSVVKELIPEGKTTCLAVTAPASRHALYLRRRNPTKMALGHHR